MYKQFTFAAVLALASQVSAVKIAATQEIDLIAEPITVEPVTIEPVTIDVAQVEELTVTDTAPQDSTTVVKVTDSLPSFMTNKTVTLGELPSNPTWVTDKENGFATLPRID